MNRATRWLRGLWLILGSSRLATILLAALLLASLLGSLFPQMPVDGSAGLTVGDPVEPFGAPVTRQSWLAAAALRYGSATGLLRGLGLFSVQHAPWFLMLLCALLLNTLICTIKRLPRLLQLLTQHPTVVRPEAFYRRLAHRAEWPVLSLQAGLDMAQDALAQRRYKVHLEYSTPAHCANIYAERGRWAQVSTLVGHAAALLLVIAVVVRGAVGWQETAVVLLPGQIHSVGHGQNFSVQAGELALDHYADGQPGDYSVPLTLLVDSSPALTHTVRINHPLTYCGVAFHLQGYGPAAQLSTPEGTFDLILDDIRSRQVALPEAGFTLRTAYQPEGDTLFVEALAEDGSPLGSGGVTDGQEIDIQGTLVVFTLTRYTIWQLSHDPTFGPALGLGGLLLIAALISLWVPHQRIWLRVHDQRVQMAATAASHDYNALVGHFTDQTAKARGSSEVSKGEERG
jgi:cytochrome c biogenesis protein